MKNRIIVILLVCLYSIAPGQERKSAVVLDFVNQGAGSEYAHLEKSLPDTLNTSMIEQGYFIMTSRKKIKRTVRELGLTAAQLAEPGAAYRIGSRLGVDAVITGRFRKEGGRILLYTAIIGGRDSTEKAKHEMKLDTGAALFDQMDELARIMTGQYKDSLSARAGRKVLSDPFNDSEINERLWFTWSQGLQIEEKEIGLHVSGKKGDRDWGTAGVQGKYIELEKEAVNGIFTASVEFRVFRMPEQGFSVGFNLNNMKEAGARDNKTCSINFNANKGAYDVGKNEAGRGRTGSGSVPAFGDEDRIYHRMKMVYDLNTGKFAGYIDEKLIATVVMEPARYMAITLSVASGSDEQVHVVFRNLVVQQP